MSLEIYPSDFSTRYGLYGATSISMSVYYNETGKIQITEPMDEYNIAAIATGNIVYDTERGTTYIIVSVIRDTTQRSITANGYTTDWLLSKRAQIVDKQITNIETGVRELVTENMLASGDARNYPRIVLGGLKGYTEQWQPDDAETTDEDESRTYGGQLLETVEDLLEYGGLGRRMIWNGDKLQWTFDIYKGEDRTTGIHQIAFVEEQGTCSDLVIEEDISTFKNVAYGRYMYNEQEYLTSVGDATGENRHEYWSSVMETGEDGDTQAKIESRAKASLALELKNYISRQSFTVTIDPSELGTRYSLGDVVSCVSNRFSISFTARITGVKYTMDATGESTSIVLGDPTLTALGALKLNG